MTKQYASPAVLKKLAEARHGVPLGTVRPPFVPVPTDYDPEAALACRVRKPAVEDLERRCLCQRPRRTVIRS